LLVARGVKFTALAFFKEVEIRQIFPLNI